MLGSRCIESAEKENARHFFALIDGVMGRRRMFRRKVLILLTGMSLAFGLYFPLFSPGTTPNASDGCRLSGKGNSLAAKALVDDSAITTNSTLENDWFWLPSFSSSFDTDKCRLALISLKLSQILADGTKNLDEKNYLYNCESVFEVVKYCHRFNGLKPLPNFYLRKKKHNSDNFKEKDYLRAHLAFIHVPKSGGTSVETFLKTTRIRPVVEERVTLLSLTHCKTFLSALNRIKPFSNPFVFYSKRSFGIHYFLPTVRTFMYATWVREPVSRFLSTYYYHKLKRYGGQPRNSKYVYHSTSLNQFLRRTRHTQLPEYDNFMVRLLQFGDFPEIDGHFEDCCGASSPDTMEVEEKHYLVAKRNLQLMAFIGLTEDFKVSQDMFMKILGKKPATKVVHRNTNPHSTNITEWERSEIERRTFWDIKLYQDAKKIYKEQKKEYLSKQAELLWDSPTTTPDGLY